MDLCAKLNPHRQTSEGAVMRVEALINECSAGVTTLRIFLFADFTCRDHILQYFFLRNGFFLCIRDRIPLMKDWQEVI